MCANIFFGGLTTVVTEWKVDDRLDPAIAGRLQSADTTASGVGNGRGLTNHERACEQQVILSDLTSSS